MKGRTPPPREPIVTLVYGGDADVAVYLNNTLLAQGDCELDLAHILEHLSVHVHTLDGEACFDPATAEWPPTLAEALRLPLIHWHPDGSWSEDETETLERLNQQRARAA
jgi:hypothetical protein